MTTNRRVIFLNGPPSSGKDTLANALRRHDPKRFTTYAMKRPMQMALTEFLGLNYLDVMKWNTDPVEKGQSQAALYGASWRATQIHFAETFAKPFFGKDVFGKLAVYYLTQSAMPITVISDSGFRDECIPVVKYLQPKNCLLIRLHREGCTFAGDSRSYHELADVGVTEADLYFTAQHTVEMATARGVLTVYNWLKEETDVGSILLSGGTKS